MNDAHPWRPVKITLTAVLLIIAALALIDHKIATAMVKDDGLVQIITACLLCTCVVLGVLHVVCRSRPAVAWREAAFILCIYCMREMDFHRLFTAEHVTRLKLYTGAFPLEQKLIGGIIMIAFIAVMIHFLATNAPLFYRSLMNKIPLAWHVVVWVLLLAGAQIIDKPRIFRGSLKTITEESMELGAALMMLFILLSFPLDYARFFRTRR